MADPKTPLSSDDDDDDVYFSDDVADDDDEPVRINLTGSIQDADLAEAIAEAHQKHGHRLADLIRSL